MQRGQNFLVFEHMRKGIVQAEVNASLGGRHDTKFWYGAAPPFQDVRQQYTQYIEEVSSKSGG